MKSEVGIFLTLITILTSSTMIMSEEALAEVPTPPTPPTPTPLADYWVTVTAGPGGTISDGAGFTTPGTSYTFAITPNAGYQILDVTDNGVSKGAISTYQLTNIHENHEISATFSPTLAGTYNLIIIAVAIVSIAAITTAAIVLIKRKSKYSTP